MASAQGRATWGRAGCRGREEQGQRPQVGVPTCWESIREFEQKSDMIQFVIRKTAGSSMKEPTHEQVGRQSLNEGTQLARLGTGGQH